MPPFILRGFKITSLINNTSPLYIEKSTGHKLWSFDHLPELIQKLTLIPKLRKNDKSPEIGRQPSSKFWFENFECAPSRTKTWSSLSTSKSMA